MTERHKALAKSLDTFAHSVHEQGENIDKLIGLAEKQTTHIEALFKIVDSHERRLARIEERPNQTHSRHRPDGGQTVEAPDARG